MRCEEFENLVEALGRGDPMEEVARHEALRHAEVCAACHRHLDEARALTAALRTVARENRDMAASPGLESRMMEAFDNRGAVRRVSPWPNRVLAGAVAALFLCSVGYTLWRHPPVAKDSRLAAVAPAADVETQDTDEIATEFFPLYEGSDLDDQEAGEVVRVWVPRPTLLAFGLPMNDERSLEPLQAEILVGKDGAAHAIRFINDQR